MQQQEAVGSTSLMSGKQTLAFCRETPRRANSCSWRPWLVWYVFGNADEQSRCWTGTADCDSVLNGKSVGYEVLTADVENQQTPSDTV